MKAICELARLPAGITLLADDILEFHAARIILLIRLCGTKNRIDGLTKLAKLDFFVRYPQFFDRACAASGEHIRSVSNSIEASMVRHHYGPWDHRYYDVLAYLRSRGLIEIRKDKKTFKFYLTEIGQETALDLPPTFQGITVAEKENFILEPFIDLTNMPSMKNTQVIATGNSFLGLEGVNQIVFDHVWK